MGRVVAPLGRARALPSPSLEAAFLILIIRNRYLPCDPQPHRDMAGAPCAGKSRPLFVHKAHDPATPTVRGRKVYA
jgi:hypothetical protein